MKLGEIMLYLQQNSKNGTIIAMCVVVVLYLLFSIIFTVVARKSGINLCATGMIPIYNLHIPVRVVIRKHNSKKQLKVSEEEKPLAEDEEIIF